MKDKHRVYWSDKEIEYDGIPFMVLGTKILDCHHGKDRHAKQKEDAKKRHENTWVG